MNITTAQCKFENGMFHAQASSIGYVEVANIITIQNHKKGTVMTFKHDCHYDNLEKGTRVEIYESSASIVLLIITKLK